MKIARMGETSKRSARRRARRGSAGDCSHFGLWSRCSPRHWPWHRRVARRDAASVLESTSPRSKRKHPASVGGLRWEPLLRQLVPSGVANPRARSADAIFERTNVHGESSRGCAAGRPQWMTQQRYARSVSRRRCAPVGVSRTALPRDFDASPQSGSLSAARR